VDDRERPSNGSRLGMKSRSVSGAVTMDDRDRLAAAIPASGYSARRYATAVLGVDERTVRRWLASDTVIPGPVRVISAAILRRPAIAQELADALDAIRDS
jgi:hypothetical protein